MAVERVGSHTTRLVDVRIVAATNRSLKALVQANRFRADLFYRLAGVEVYVPPLRARREDIPLLVAHFLVRYGRHANAFSASAIEALSTYDWPGNVRQLARVLERAIALSIEPAITVADLPAEITQDYRDLLRDEPDRDDSLRAWSSRYVRLVLDRAGGNKSRACDVLGISYHTLQSHLEYAPCSRREAQPPAPVVHIAGARSSAAG
jgi:two-component system NtrC family response regulator